MLNAIAVYVSCAFHCFIFPERNELLNWYVQCSHFFSGIVVSSSFSLLFYFVCVFVCECGAHSFISFFCTMRFVPFFISFGHYLLYATQWRFFLFRFFLLVFLSLFANRHVSFVCHRFSFLMLSLFLSLLLYLWSHCCTDLSPKEKKKYTLQSYGDGNSDNQKQSK